jgi:hypothetical protein
MTDLVAGRLSVSRPDVNWSIGEGALTAMGACLLLALMSFFVFTSFSFDPVALTGETMWLRS